MKIQDHDEQFDRWLDEWIARPDPIRDEPPGGSARQDVQTFTTEFHMMARRSEERPRSQALPNHWEEFMHVHHLDASSPGTNTGQTASRSSRVKGSGFPAAMDTLNARPARLASNILLAAIVLAVLVAGGWRAAQFYSLGPPEEPATIPFGAFGQDDATPAAETEVDLLAPATADQCTITPLTVDEVIAIVQDPYAAEMGTSAIAQDGTPAGVDDLVPATPEIDPEAVRPDEFATDEALAGVTETFHMFEACIEAGSYFQAWATWHPVLLQQSILYALPPLTGEDDLRALLTDLEANGPGDPQDPDTIFWPLGSGPMMSPIDAPEEIVRIARTVDQNPENTWMPEPHFVVTGYTNHYPDSVTDEMPPTSIYDEDNDGTPDPLIGYDPRLKQPSCFTIIFMWSDARDMWLIQQYPVCG